MTSSKEKPLGGTIEDTIEVTISEPVLDYFLKMSLGYLTNSEKFSLMDYITKKTKRRISFAFILSNLYFKQRHKNKRLCKKIENIEGMNEMIQHLSPLISSCTDDKTIENIIDAELSSLFYNKNNNTIYLL